jgi:hypothetical protein
MSIVCVSHFDWMALAFVLLKPQLRGYQEELFKLVMLNFIFKWYNWSNFWLLMASH